MNIKATGLLTKSSSGETLDAYFPVIKFNAQKTDIQDITDNLEKEVVEIHWTQKNLDEPIEDVVSAYLKLHLISYRFALPNSVNLDGLFNALPNVASNSICTYNLSPQVFDTYNGLLDVIKLDPEYASSS